MRFNLWRFLPGVRERYALKFVSVLLAIALVVSAFGGYIYVHTGDELESDVRDQLVDDAQQDADRLDVWFRSTGRYMESLPRSTAFRNGDEVAISDALHRANDRTAFAGAYYVDPEQGTVRVRAGTTDVVDDDRRLNGPAADRLSSAMDDSSRVVFSEAFETADGRPAMLVVSKVPGRTDRVVAALVDLSMLSRYMIGDRGEDDVVVLDDRGTVVLAENRDDILAEDPVDPAALETDTGVASIGEGATEVGYSRLDSAGWTLTTRVPAADAYSLQSDVSNQILAMIAVVLGGMVLFGATIGRNTARSVRRLSRKAEAIEAGDLGEEIESDRHDEIGDLYRSFDGMRRALRERIEEAQAARSEAERARAASERFSEHLEATADDYGETMRACADGDLTRRLDPDERSDAMARVATEFNAMLDDIEATVSATRAFADAVDEATESTADGVAEVRTASRQVTTSVQQIADGAERQSDHLAAVGDEIDDLSTTTEEIAATTSEVATLAERTAETGANARESARRAIAGLNAIEEEADGAVAEVEQLEREMDAIDDLLEFIGEVARETNLLALNASIEASRSDAAGEGFTAVAEQVKDLAAETQEAATDVETRLERVQQQTNRVGDVVRETSERVSGHRGAIEDAVSSLDEISSFAAETNDGVQEISAASQQQAAATGELVAMTDDVTAISEETSAEAETVAAAAEEQTSSLVEVSRSAEALSGQARELSALLASFEVDADPSAADALPDAGETPAAKAVVGAEALEERPVDEREGEGSNSPSGAEFRPSERR